MTDAREALKPFARAADIYEQSQEAANQADLDQAKCNSTVAVLREPIADTARVSVTMGDCRKARSALRAPALPQANGVREAIYECASIADKYDDCGGAFIAEKIRALASEGKKPV